MIFLVQKLTYRIHTARYSDFFEILPKELVQSANSMPNPCQVGLEPIGHLGKCKGFLIIDFLSFMQKPNMAAASVLAIFDESGFCLIVSWHFGGSNGCDRSSAFSVLHNCRGHTPSDYI